jgi:FlaA1/EpsC-like NDP-sugar epimerase
MWVLADLESIGHWLTPSAFIVTGGTGSIGRDVARAIIAKGGTAVVRCLAA